MVYLRKVNKTFIEKIMSAATEIQPMFLVEDDAQDLDIHFDPNQFEPVTPYTNDLNEEYEQAQEQLRQLRQQEEQVQQQAEELAELTRREEEFTSGREDVSRKLENYLSHFSREATEAQRIANECIEAQERFESHLNNINMLRPESWSRADRKAELARALGYIDSADNAIENTMPLIEGLGIGKRSGWRALFPSGGTKSSPTDGFRKDGDFFYWLKSGFAFSLPLISVGLIAAVWVLLF